MVTINGFPKAGNHALAKACQLLGQPCVVSHIPHGGDVGEKHILIKRDPRNILCSWLRFIGQPVTPGTFLTAFRDFQGKHFVEAMADYEEWQRDAGTLVVRYEELIRDDEEIKRIADYLGMIYLPNAFENLPGMTRTWNPDHSDYRSIWTDEVQAAWAAEGGNTLLAAWGYA